MKNENSDQIDKPNIRRLLIYLSIFALAGALLLVSVLQRTPGNAPENVAQIEAPPGYAAKTGADRSDLSDESVAARRGLTVEQVRRLQKERALANDDIARLTDAQLKRALSRLEQPKPMMLEEMFRQRAAQMRDENGEMPNNALLRAVEQKKRLPFDARVWGGESKNERLNADDNTDPSIAGIDRNSWAALGPGNIGGRTRAIAIHPTNANIIYLGSVGGGVWKTTNGGASWQPLNDFMPNLAVTALVIDPTNTNVIYAATGEAFFGDTIRGAGIFKSFDAGATWTQLPSTANGNFYGVTRLAMNPNNSQILLASTGKVNNPAGGSSNEGAGAIWRTINGGATWTQVLSGGGFLFTDVDFNPFNGNFAVAGSTTEPGTGCCGIAWYSTDGGQSWGPSTGTYVGGRVEVTYAVANPARVYASIDQDSGALYYSNDGGQSFTRINITGAPNYLGSQGSYDNVVWAGDPTNLNHVIIGGIDLYGATNAVNFTKISNWQNGTPGSATSAHADQHVIVAHPQYNGTSNCTVFFGNDGGIFKAVDVYAAGENSGWTELNNNLSITQFYGAAGHAATGRIVGGTQDNGTLRFRPGVANPTENWNMPFGGDGGWSAYDPVDANFFYGEYVFLQIHRATTADGFSQPIHQGITEATGGSANFIAPFILDPNDSNRLLGGARSLWRSNNAKAATPTWAAIKPPTAGNSPISAIAVKRGDANQIWVGHNDGSVYRTANGLAANPIWTQIFGLPARYVTRITLGNAGDNRAYVTLGGFSAGNVQVSSNNGASWSNAASGLPQAPVRSLVINPGNPDWLYIGTEVGVFASTNGGASWSTTNDGPANVSVDELFWMGDKLIAATHGRGLFSATVLTPSAAPVTISGRVVTADGRGIRGARLTLTDAAGETRTVLSSQFGYYRFADVQAGATYVLSAQAKRFTFEQPTQTFFAGEDLSAVDFIASP